MLLLAAKVADLVGNLLEVINEIDLKKFRE
jgi:hypothetical protein